MSDRTARHRAAWCSLVVATTLLAAGCSGSDPEPAPAQAPGASSPSASSSAAAVPSTATSPTPSTTTPAPVPSATDAPVQALASRDFTVTGTYSQTRVRMRLSVTELKRRGELLDLTATLTNLEQDRSRDLRWQVGSRFAGSYRKDLEGTDGAFSGGVLTDVAGKKRYFVAADSANACVCTVQLSSAFVGAGQSIDLNATYAAPPATTTKLDVAIASLGNFRDLPVS
jgi:hypothetical protein